MNISYYLLSNIGIILYKRGLSNPLVPGTSNNVLPSEAIQLYMVSIESSSNMG
jgi:hypothetical protein